jgi:hypothetical protein
MLADSRCSGGVVMDVAMVSEAVAGLLAAGGVKELGEAAGGGLAAGIIDWIRKVFGSDARSLDALERTRQGEPGAVAELASALAWYAGQNQVFAQELAAWAAQAGADRQGFTAGAGGPGRVRRGPGPDRPQLPLARRVTLATRGDR